MSGEDFLFYFCGQSDEISTRCWITSLSVSLSVSLSLRKRIEDFQNSEDLMAEFIFS